MNRSKLCPTVAALLGAALSVPALAQPDVISTILTEDFDDGAANTRWSAPVVDAETGTFDGQVIYNFDYGAVGIPAAPGGGSSTGVLFEVNTTDQGGDQGEAVAIVPEAFTLPDTNYRFTVDVYYNVESANSGSSEFGLYGLHAAAFNAPTDQSINDDLPFDFGISDGNGLTYHASGDSGAFNDFHRYEDAGNADAGSQTGLGSYDNREDADAASFPSLSDPISQGPRNTWVQVVLERIDDEVTFSVDGTVIDVLEDASAFTAGTILLGYADYFNSVAVKTFDVPGGTTGEPIGDDIPGFAHFVVYDNVTVQTIVPEPASAAALGLLGLAGLRRRSA